MKPVKKLKKKAPMTVRQQAGTDEGMRRLQREPQTKPGTSRSFGDEANKSRYEMQKYVSGRRSRGQAATYAKGGKVGDPKKKDDKSYTTLREGKRNRPTESELKYMLKGPGSDKFLRELPKVIKAREAAEKRNPASGKAPSKSYSRTITNKKKSR